MWLVQVRLLGVDWEPSLLLTDWPVQDAQSRDFHPESSLSYTVGNLREMDEWMSGCIINSMIRKRRTYTLHKRAQAAQDTRLSIIAATHTLLAETGYPDISLDDIARRAGVSRQTIYIQFGSKSGVLQAVGEHIEHAALEGLIPTLLQTSKPLEALRSGLERVVNFYEHDAQVLRNLHAQTVYDASYATVWGDKQQEIWSNTRRLVEWLDREGCLTAAWSVEEATDWLWAASSFESYDQLVGERGWTTEQFVRRIVQLVEKTLLAPEESAHPRK